jgi:hypothetical protein
MPGSDIYIYERTKDAGRDAGRSSPTLGQLVFRQLEISQPPPSGLLLVVQWIPTRLSGPDSGYRWVWLSGEMRSRRTPRAFGSVRISVDERPKLDGESDTLRWHWQLLPDDLEVIERERSASPKAPVSFDLDLTGIVQNAGGAYTVEGDGSPSVAVSDWTDLLASLGYATPPSASTSAGSAVLDHPAWAEAEKKLAKARTLLRTGDTHSALEQALSQFEGLATAPYSADRWTAWLEDRYDEGLLPVQKRESIANLLAGYCSYLNRVGHHRAREVSDPAGDLLIMPLNGWEGETALVEAQYLLAYSERLDMSRTKKA